MRQIKLTPFKRLMLIVLAAFVNMVYHTNLSAYTTQTATNGNCTASTTGWACRRISSWGQSFIQGPVSLYNTGVENQVCLCLSTEELNSAANCRQAASGSSPNRCNAMYTGTDGSVGYIYYDVVAKSCNGTLDCYCAAGYYAANSTTCRQCASGYYCSMGGNMVGNLNVTPASSALCSTGYYQPNIGQRSCYRCPSASSASGTTYGVTANTGATSVTDCYIASTQKLQDALGYFTFVKDCYGTSDGGNLSS